MKPLPAAPLTSEDWEIRKHLEIMDQRRWLQTMDLIEGADRRDAALMYQAQHNRWAPLPWAPGWAELMPPWLETITFGGCPVGGDIARYITACA